MDLTSKVHIVGDNIVSFLGWTTQDNYSALIHNKVGLKHYDADDLVPFDHVSSVLDKDKLNNKFNLLDITGDYTTLEKMCILSIRNAMESIDLLDINARLGFIFSTTKGNIDLLLKKDARFNGKRKYLYNTAEVISDNLGFVNRPIVISNACISGVAAIVMAKRLIESGAYDDVVVCGADLVTPFTLTGFNSLKALSKEHCRPFDFDRNGINLGEAAATIVVSSRQHKSNKIDILSGSISNDANHISGPSRSGEGMQKVIHETLKNYSNKIDFISAHGTATKYNDQMEATALHSKQLSHVPVHSLKGYYGHTLGAAGIVESIIGYQSIINNLLIKSMGFEKTGTTEIINVINKNIDKNINNCLKISSGFGGCNAAVLFEKNHE